MTKGTIRPRTRVSMWKNTKLGWTPRPGKDPRGDWQEEPGSCLIAFKASMAHGEGTGTDLQRHRRIRNLKQQCIPHEQMMNECVDD